MKNRVRIIAPAGMYKEGSPEKLQNIIEFLASHGFVVSVQENIFAGPPLPFYANTKELRLKGLREAISSPDVDIIWAFRGGYGCGEIAEDCMDMRPVGEKILIGASDLTVLHTLFNQHYNLSSIHGPVLVTLVDRNPKAISDIEKVIRAEEQKLPLIALNAAAKTSSKISSPITGGNLTVFTTLIGTKLHPVTKGKILLLEDVNEEGYKLARMFNHLEKAGLLNGLSACILGDFTGGDGDVDWAINKFVTDHRELPIFRVQDVGHRDINHPVVLGNNSTIEDGILKCQLG